MQIKVCCVIKKGEKFLFEKRRDDEDNYANLWAFRGGGIEENETPQDALVREMAEELNIRLRDPKYFCKINDIDPTSNKVFIHYVFLCDNYHGEIIATREQEKIEWLSLEEALNRNISTKDKAIILRLKKIHNDKTY